MGGLPVSGSACELLGRLHSVLTPRRTLGRPDNGHLFLDAGGEPRAPRLEPRGTQGGRAYGAASCRQNPPWEPERGEGILNDNQKVL